MIATPTRVSTTAISADRTAVKSVWPRANTRQPADDQDHAADQPPERTRRRTDETGCGPAPAGPAGVVRLPPDEGAADGRQAERSEHVADPVAETQRGAGDQQRHTDGGDAVGLPALGGARPSTGGAGVAGGDEDPQQGVGDDPGAAHQGEQGEDHADPGHRHPQVHADAGGNTAQHTAVADAQQLGHAVGGEPRIDPIRAADRPARPATPVDRGSGSQRQQRRRDGARPRTGRPTRAVRPVRRHGEGTPMPPTTRRPPVRWSGRPEPGRRGGTGVQGLGHHSRFTRTRARAHRGSPWSEKPG